MAWAIIRASDNVWLGGPLESEPTPGEGEYIVIVADGYPDRCEWSPSRGGFVDIVAPATARMISRLAFYMRFTQTERIDIRASLDPIVRDYLSLCDIAENIDLDNAVLVPGVQYLESVELIGPGRAAEILT